MSSSPKDKFREALTGLIDIIPLCLAVLPWGILAGSMAVQAGLSIAQSIAMSAIIFAGAAQLVTLGMIGAGAGTLTILISIFFLTSQHFLYGLTLREYTSTLKIRYRVAIGFLLTDELFALTATKDKKTLSLWYVIGSGFFFYICWIIFSIIGIYMASTIPNLQQYHLDFSIVATFITIVVPMIKGKPVLCGVLFSLITSMLLSYLNVEGAIIIAGLLGMFFSVLIDTIFKEKA